MSGKNIVELAANKDIDTASGFEGTFPSLHVDELMLEFDPKHVGPPIALFGNGSGGTKEFHLIPLRGREGRFSTKVGGTESWTTIKVTLARGKTAKLLKVKLIGKPPVA